MFIVQQVNESTDTILLNASELEVRNITFKGDDGNELAPEKYDLNQDTKTLTIKFAEKLVAGKTGQLSMQFEGPLNDSMRGFYRCKHTRYDFCVQYFAISLDNAITLLHYLVPKVKRNIQQSRSSKQLMPGNVFRVGMSQLIKPPLI